MVPANEAPIHRVHGHARARDIPRSGEHRPALRNRIDLAFGIAYRPERRAIIEVGTEIPPFIPAMLLDSLAHVGRLSLATFSEGQVTTQACHLREPHEHVIQEKA